MKKFFVAVCVAAALASAPALAADMPVKAPAPMAAAPVFSWTGFYVGGEGGYAWGRSFHCFSCDAGGGSIDPFSIKGGVGGLTAGYNVQLNPSWVAGIETDFSFADIGGKGHSSATFNCALFCHTGVDWFGTVRGRVGLASGNALYYATGGWAYGRAEGDISDCATISSFGNCGRKNVDGWTAGGGIEYAFAHGWSAKIEYLHVDFGRFVYQNANDGCTGISCSATAKFDVVRFGLNYRFGGDPWSKAPVVAKY